MIKLNKIEEVTDEVLKNNTEIEIFGKVFRRGYDWNEPEPFRVMLRREFGGK